MALPTGFLEELKDKNDITSIVSGYVNLKKKGRYMVGLCPFHNEKTPSFYVYPNTDSFYCFGCAKGGDVITFMMGAENLDYIDAVKMLAQRVGMSVPTQNQDDGISKLRGRILEANREAALYYYKCLYSKDGQEGLSYFKNRALTNDTIKHFGLGYAPKIGYALCNHLKGLGFSDYEIIQANLGFRSNRTGRLFDKFIDRVMFPLIDVRGNVVAFAGRTLNKTDDGRKYVNTSDTPVFKKSMNIFALNYAKNTKEKNFIIVEGYMDVIALHQAGIENVIAVMGTSFTEEQAHIISRYTNEVVLCFDSDSAGQKATARAINILRKTDLSLKVIAVPGNKDPDEFLRANGDKGAEKFRLLLEKSSNDVEFRLNKLRLEHNMDTADGRVAFLTDAAKLLSNVNNEIERDVYISKLAIEMNITKEAFIRQIGKYTKQNKKNDQKRFLRSFQQEALGRNDKINKEKSANLRACTAEEMLIACLYKNSDNWQYFDERIKSEDFVTEFNRRIFSCMIDKLKNGGNADILGTRDKFTSDEDSQIVRIINLESGTLDSANEYIDRILSSKASKNIKQNADTKDEDILEYLNSLKRGKK